MQVLEVIALVFFIVIAAALFITIRRTDRIVAGPREADGFRDAVADIANRTQVSLDVVAGRIDQVRRRTLDPGLIVEDVASTRAAVHGYAEEAAALQAPGGSESIRDALLGELGRAERALESVEHGSTLLAAAGHELAASEGQISIKRGYLNVLHVREAVQKQAAAAGELATQARRRPRM
jgi:hypothetical protein